MAYGGLPDDLPALVKARFNAAKEAGELTFWPTEVTILDLNGIPFQLRFAPIISQKPTSAKLKGGSQQIDPFLEPPKALLITETGTPPSHTVVLNKFAIVPEHFIVATKEFKEQTHLLEADDLGVAYACLQSWRAQGKELFAFFNSGVHSGASQPHRHLQFLPVESMKVGLTEEKWQPLIDKLATSPRPDLPFVYFTTSIPPNSTPLQLQQIYLSLHKRACQAVASSGLEKISGDSVLQTGEKGPSPISYNLGITDSVMVLMPRRAEGVMISTGLENPQSIGPVAHNGTVLAGALLVKTKMEWDTLIRDVSKLRDVYEGTCFPSSSMANGRL